MTKPPTVAQRWNTATEQLIGGLTARYKANPERAVETLERLLAFSKFITGDQQMRKTYTIDLKIDFDDDTRHKVMLHLSRKMARMLLTQAALIADNRQPQVALTCDDFFEGGSKEALMDLPDQNPEEDPGDGILSQE
jgi:hypothetical protein